MGIDGGWAGLDQVAVGSSSTRLEEDSSSNLQGGSRLASARKETCAERSALRYFGRPRASRGCG